MGTQGSCSRAIARKEAVGQGRRVRLTYIMSSLLLGPALAACSSFASLSPGPNQSAAVSPPASPAVAAAQPGSMAPAPGAHDSAASISPYPKQSLVDLFREDSEPAPAAPGARSVAVASPSDDPAASISPYPKRSLVDVFREDAAPTPTANVPHPPSSYTPSGQPYVPSSGQPNYGAPAAAAPAAAAASQRRRVSVAVSLRYFLEQVHFTISAARRMRAWRRNCASARRQTKFVSQYGARRPVAAASELAGELTFMCEQEECLES